MITTLTKHDRDDLEKLKQKLIIVWANSTVPRLDTPFFEWCQHSCNPYVRIQKARNSASIFMDLPNESGLLDPEGFNQFRNLCLSYGVPDQGDAFKKPSLQGIPLEFADEFAGKLVVIGRQYCSRNPSGNRKAVNDSAWREP